MRTGAWRPGHRIPSEREIARQAGVSQMTANRAIQELVRTGWLVRRAGAGTFVSEATARPPAERGLVLVAPFTAHPEEDVYLRVPFTAIRQGADAEGCSVAVARAAEGSFGDIVDRHPNSAFIFAAPPEQSRRALADLHEQGVPFVVMGASWPEEAFTSVDTDNVGGASTAVEYLIRLGHRRIAFVSGPASAVNCQDRVRGYRQALLAHDLSVDDAYVVMAGSEWDLSEAARRELMALLLRPDPITAIVSAGYYLALAVYSLIASLSLKIPDDVSVVGFDDPRSAAHLSPPLTTVRQPLSELGERAAQRALALLEGLPALAGAVELLPVEFVIRASCARLEHSQELHS